MKRYEIRGYFHHNSIAPCQHCGKEIHWRDREHRTGKYADYKPDERFWWTAYSKAAYKADADYEILCRNCYEEAVQKYGRMISREEMLERIDKILGIYAGGGDTHREGMIHHVVSHEPSTPETQPVVISSHALTHSSYSSYSSKISHSPKKSSLSDVLAPLINTAIGNITLAEIQEEKQRFLHGFKKGSSFSYDMTSASWGPTEIYAPWGVSWQDYVDEHAATGIIDDIKKLHTRELALAELAQEGFLKPICKDGNDKLSYCVHCRDGKRFITIPYKNAKLEYDRFLVVKEYEEKDKIQHEETDKHNMKSEQAVQAARERGERGE